jgi:hypothetical protein
MVTGEPVRRVVAAISVRLAWAAEQAEPLLMRLTPQNRSLVLMALLGMLLVGAGLIALAVIGGRQVLREARKKPNPTPRLEDGWYRKPLVPRDGDSPLRETE